MVTECSVMASTCKLFLLETVTPDQTEKGVIVEQSIVTGTAEVQPRRVSSIEISIRFCLYVLLTMTALTWQRSTLEKKKI